MSQTSQSFRHEAEKTSTSTSEFHFPGMDQGLESANENMPEMLVNSCFELLPKGQIAPKLKLIFRNGNRHFFPYAYILEVAFDVEGRLTLLTSEREIIIEGRGLDNLEEWIFESRVKWVKEDNRSFDPHEEGIFINNIEVKDRREGI